MWQRGSFGFVQSYEKALSNASNRRVIPRRLFLFLQSSPYFSKAVFCRNLTGDDDACSLCLSAGGRPSLYGGMSAISIAKTRRPRSYGFFALLIYAGSAPYYTAGTCFSKLSMPVTLRFLLRHFLFMFCGNFIFKQVKQTVSL
jgi:hypothetical protein